eukprot:4496777-Alexandrium_andersonii.AAC.1
MAALDQLPLSARSALCAALSGRRGSPVALLVKQRSGRLHARRTHLAKVSSLAAPGQDRGGD